MALPGVFLLLGCVNNLIKVQSLSLHRRMIAPMWMFSGVTGQYYRYLPRRSYCPPDLQNRIPGTTCSVPHLGCMLTYQNLHMLFMHSSCGVVVVLSSVLTQNSRPKRSNGSNSNTCRDISLELHTSKLLFFPSYEPKQHIKWF